MKRSAKRWWTRLVTVLAVLTVAAAAISAGFKLLIDSVPGYRHELERAVAGAVGHPARIGSMALTWSGLRPTLELRDVALLDGRDAALLALRRIRLGLSPTRLITGPRSPDRVEIDGVRLSVAIGADGRVRLDGIDLAASGDRPLADELARFAQLRLHDVDIRLRDARLGAEPLEVHVDHASLRHGRGGYRVDALLMPPPGVAGRLQLNATFDGSLADRASLDGRWSFDVEALAGWPWLATQLAPGSRIALDDARIDASGTIDAGRLGAASLRLRAGRLSALVGGVATASLAAVDIGARFETLDGGWRLQLPVAGVSGARGPWKLDGLTVSQAADGTQTLIAPLLRLDDLAPWLAVIPALPPKLARLGDLRGDVAALRVSRAAPSAVSAAAPSAAAAAVSAAAGETPDLVASARLLALGMVARGEQPGFAGLSGELEGGIARGVVRLTGTPLELRLPTAFGQPLPIDRVTGELHWERQGEVWRLASPALALRLGSSEAEGPVRLRIHPEGSVPELKLDLTVKSDAVAALKPWMPKTWGANSRAWLERAVLDAKVAGGRLLIDAPLTPRDANNRPTLPWRLTLDVEDAVLAFARDWPAAEGIAAQLVFHDNGLDILGREGTISGLAVSRLDARIADFASAELVLDADFSGDAGALYRLFRESPLKARVGGLISRTEASGPVRGDLKLRVPLNIAQPPVDATGTLLFDGAALAVRGMAEPLRELRGALRYGKSIAAEALTARLYDTAVSARIVSESGRAEPVLLGEFTLEPGRDDGLAAAYLPRWLRSGLGGAAGARLRLPLAGADAGRLSIASDLHGVVSSLPSPLGKAAGSRLPLALELSGEAGATRVRIAVDDAFKATVRLADAGDGGNSRTRGVEALLGSGRDYPRADADGLVIGGAPESLDLAGWIAVIAAVGANADGGAAGPPFLRADVTPRQTRLRRWTFGPTRLLALPDGEGGGIRLRAEGAATGTVDWQTADGGRVVARFDHLALDALPPLPPVQAGVAPADSPFDPTRAPVFDIDARALSLGGVSLGQLQVATARVADGQRIDRLSFAGGRLDGSATGSWLRRALDGTAASSAELEFDLRSDAIGDVLRVFGYTPNLVAEDARFTGNVVWPRVPAGLELSQATGDIAIDVRRGSLKAVEPGAGRVLGLVNLYALPRRLLFDFKDVVADGLGFDRVKGRFTLADGNAVTDDLDIDSPSLKIEMRGRIGLAARDYDQKVTVFPDLSTGVTIGATLLGGPIAGGIVLVAQQLFDKPFNQLGRFSYRVTGSWDDPAVLKGGDAPESTLESTPESTPEPEAANG